MKLRVFSVLLPLSISLLVDASLQSPLVFQGLGASEIFDKLKNTFIPPEYTKEGRIDETISYKSLEAELWPLDLTQYENYKIIRIPLHGQEDKTVSKQLIELKTIYPIWEVNNKFIDLKIPQNDLKYLEELEINYSILIDDLPQTIFETFPSETEDFNQILTQDFTTNKEIFFEKYRTLDTIYSWLDLIKDSFPELVEIEHLGETFEKRDIKAIHLGSNAGLNPEKKTIVITGGVHAREWISVSTALYTIYQLVTKYGVSKKETNYLNHLEFLIIPVFNPDGYEYTWTKDRLWRKNRQETYLDSCFGVDIDHTFNYHWEKSDDYPCGESYSGEEEFASVEAQALNHYINITKEDHRIYGFLDLHSYTEKILYPYAYSCDDLPRDRENLLELAYGLSKSIRLEKGKHYEVLPACKDRGVDILPGLGAGSSLDYMYHNRARWAFQFKLRDTGSHGFLLPDRYIKPVGKELYRAIQYFCQFIINPEL
ncbi:hypothetical protein WICMUC_002326 [Wickerhamomyces mucosus]|uniref:Inactive metallocarboxypeptidase ECM14 n=1 Tax=Wickerhamomyces mucosus TaxID=1378264 RepID=A0A9P8PQW6_9ASCO|nr:hypothetical protein WICMUC_002326 [Wickerhamomyces mucosus]